MLFILIREESLLEECLCSMLKHILENIDQQDLLSYKVFHKVSSSLYTRGVLIENFKDVSNKDQWKIVKKLMTKAKRKWKIRWSYVALHWGLWLSGGK